MINPYIPTLNEDNMIINPIFEDTPMTVLIIASRALFIACKAAVKILVNSKIYKWCHKS